MSLLLNAPLQNPLFCELANLDTCTSSLEYNSCNTITRVYIHSIILVRLCVYLYMYIYIYIYVYIHVTKYTHKYVYIYI